MTYWFLLRLDILIQPSSFMFIGHLVFHVVSGKSKVKMDTTRFSCRWFSFTFLSVMETELQSSILTPSPIANIWKNWLASLHLGFPPLIALPIELIVLLHCRLNWPPYCTANWSDSLSLLRPIADLPIYLNFSPTGSSASLIIINWPGCITNYWWIA